MALSVEQVRLLVKEKPRKQELTKAVWHQNRLRFHTETVLLQSELSDYWREFVIWIGSDKPEILPDDKIQRFKQLMTCPLPTVELTESIAISLSRVFDAQDAFFRYDIDNPEIEVDWDEYRDEEYWKTVGVETMMNAIDSIWVVDFGEEDEKPSPKHLLINIADVMDLSIKDNFECNYVIFRVGDDKIYVYDDEAITSYVYDGEVKEEIEKFEHGLGYCPARTFWSECIKKTNKINHKSPLTNVLGELDWLLVHCTFKKYMDIANSFPILVTYGLNDDNEDFTREDNAGRRESHKKTDGGKFAGPGSIIQMPVPMEGQPDLMANPVKWVSPDIATLDFHVREGDRQWERIYASVVGIDGEESNDKAKNEKQVMASFESQSNILRRVAKNFEKIRAFADMTILKLRYGIDVKPSIDYGTRFFLKTTADLIEDMEEVKSSDVIYDATHSELMDIKFRNDTAGRTRAEVISDLDPLPGRTITEAKDLANSGGITKQEYKSKARLMVFIRRFEREQLPLDKFVSTGDYSKRVELIKEEFKKYESEFEQDGGDKGERPAFVPHPDDKSKGGPDGPEEPAEGDMDEGVEV